uniref:Uncharacterized protein n=1 Tax=Anguilla anguilla TaxID=7936 RepID=A0A0E9Q564_ANGAN
MATTLQCCRPTRARGQSQCT